MKFAGYGNCGWRTLEYFSSSPVQVAMVHQFFLYMRLSSRMQKSLFCLQVLLKLTA